MNVFNVVEGMEQQGGAVVPSQRPPSVHRPQTCVWGDLLSVDDMVSGHYRYDEPSLLI